MPSASSASLRPISCVAIDLTLTTSRLAGRLDEVRDDPVGLVGVGRPVHGAARRRDRLLQLHQIAVEMASVWSLIACRPRAAVPSRRARRRPWPACRGWCAWRAADWRAGSLFADGLAGGLGEGGHADEGAAVPGSSHARTAVRRSSPCSPGSPRCGPGARRSCSRVIVPPMCIRQELSAAHSTSAPRRLGVAHLVRAHRRRDVGVLHREGAAEPAALLGARQLAQLKSLDRLEQSGGPLAEAEAAQAVTGRVVCHRVRVVRADVRHAEDVHQELGQLVRLRHHGRQRRREALAAALGPSPLSHTRVQLADHRPARAGRRHDRVVPALPENIGEMPGQRLCLVAIAGVVVRLPAAGLRHREIDLDAQPGQQFHHRAARVRIERVVDTGQEQSDTHRGFLLVDHRMDAGYALRRRYGSRCAAMR